MQCIPNISICVGTVVEEGHTKNKNVNEDFEHYLQTWHNNRSEPFCSQLSKVTARKTPYRLKEIKAEIINRNFGRTWNLYVMCLLRINSTNPVITVDMMENLWYKVCYKVCIVCIGIFHPLGWPITFFNWWKALSLLILKSYYNWVAWLFLLRYKIKLNIFTSYRKKFLQVHLTTVQNRL